MAALKCKTNHKQHTKQYTHDSTTMFSPGREHQPSALDAAADKIGTQLSLCSSRPAVERNPSGTPAKYA